MSRIKSALEIALEKTDNIQGNAERLNQNERRQDGKRLFARFMSAMQDGQAPAEITKELKSSLKKFSGKDRPFVQEGYVEVLLSHLGLPHGSDQATQLEPIKNAAMSISSNGNLPLVFQQLEQFFEQYQQEKTQLLENLQQQFAARLRQKEQAYAQQTGQQVKLDPASDPEFQQYLQKAMAQLNEYYQQALTDMRDQLQQLLTA
ncbi:MAG: hypothetical protein D6B26_06665 [Spirochaetaceae bacterium]|nr:MAG: hypothetical protein D6B26_06665 [Spirochaetaceae bacterium]